MPALDSCHQQVVRALQKEGWIVENLSPAFPSLDDRPIVIDIEAWRGDNGREYRVLFIEVKCFPEAGSFTTELYKAIGQYLYYRKVLTEREVSSPLYLAVPMKVYDENFGETTRQLLSDNHIRLVIVDLALEVIVRWID
jgi:hypothetical protein